MPKRQRSEAPAAKSPASIGDALKTNLRNNQMKAAGKRQPAPSAAGGAAAGAQPAAAAAWQTDESAPFPRGGSVALTPLEYKAVATAAKEDALFEMAEGGGAVGGNAGKYDVDDDDAPALASGSGGGAASCCGRTRSCASSLRQACGSSARSARSTPTVSSSSFQIG